MTVTLKNELCRVECLQEGAMLHSLVKDETEYLWQGDKNYWGGQAPVCFPIFVTFVQSSTNEIKAQFPFDYSLEIKYTLNGNTVTTEYTVFNTGSGKLPFTIGGHPAFNCPLCDDEEFEDYFVKFDKVLTKKCLRPDVHTGLIDVSKRYSVLENTGEIRMSHTLFVDDAMVFDNMESKTALIISLYGPLQTAVRLLLLSLGQGFQPALMRMKFLKTKGE